MRIWCDTCEGKKMIPIQSFGGDIDFTKCPNCDGEGYTVNETIEHEARVGRAFKEAIQYYNLACGYKESETEICSEEELLDWAEGDE